MEVVVNVLAEKVLKTQRVWVAVLALGVDLERTYVATEEKEAVANGKVLEEWVD